MVLISVAVAILFIMAMPKINQSDSGSGGENDNANNDTRPSVEYYVPAPERFSKRVITTGSVRADEEVFLRSEVPGVITAMYFGEGSRVEAGQLLVKISDAELQPQLSRMGYQINLARIREQRQKNLLDRQAIAQEDYDVALNEYHMLLAEKELIEARIGKTEIRAPFEGFVGLKNVSPGAYITSETGIASLQKVDRVKIDFSIPEQYQHQVRVGQPMEFTLQNSEAVMHGEIYAIEPRIDSETRTLSLRALANNDDGTLLPGNYARVELELSAQSDALLIPTEALIPDIGGYRVFLYEQGKAALTRVEAGARTDARIQILSGITPQDSVITTGLLQIRDGMDVRLAEGSP
ncbi:MAG: efflux RND transporter periplasmic adaptor subunit [Balneolales bacterium]